MIYTDLLFVFCFLPIYIIVMFMCEDGFKKNLAATVLSLVFVAWSRPAYYVLIIADIFLTYIAGRLSQKSITQLTSRIVSFVVFISCLAPAIALSAENTVKGAVSAFGFLLFAARCCLYLNESNEEAENNILNLSVYLVSFEFMTISPIYTYSKLKDGIKNRRTSLAMLSMGLERFISGLFAATVLGYSLDRVRSAALLSGAVPYVNAIVGVISTALLFYITVMGYLKMSEGLLLISGYRISPAEGTFAFRSLTNDHVSSLYPSLEDTVLSAIQNAPMSIVAILTAVMCLAAGIAVGFGVGLAAFLGFIMIAILLQTLFESEKTILSGVFTAFMIILAFIALANPSLEAVFNWFGSFSPNKYEFDIGYALYEEAKRSAVWLIISLLYISPLRLAFGTIKRSMMAESERIYCAMRVVSVAVSVLLLVLSTVAMVSAVLVAVPI